jgi:hypothetical protein
VAVQRGDLTFEADDDSLRKHIHDKVPSAAAGAAVLPPAESRRLIALAEAAD